MWRLGIGRVDGGRTLVVGGSGSGAFSRISDAAAAAQPGDIIRVEPGIYHERIDVPDGVDLIARVPGTVTVGGLAEPAPDAAAISAIGDASARIAGIRIESTPERPLDVGLRLGGQGRTVELIEVAGPMHAGIDVLPAGGVTLQGSRFEVAGPAVIVAEGARAVVSGCVFLKRGSAPDSAIVAMAAAEVVLKRNVFAGYGPEAVKGLAGEALRQLRTGNAMF